MENAVPWEAPRRIHHRKETLLTEFGSDVIKTFMSKERKKGTIANTTPKKNLSDWFLIKEKIGKFISIEAVIYFTPLPMTVRSATDTVSDIFEQI